jgi:hypothetical protein
VNGISLANPFLVAGTGLFPDLLHHTKDIGKPEAKDHGKSGNS